MSDKSNLVISDTSPIVIDLASYYKDSLAEKIELIKQAIEQKNCISFIYYYKKGDTIRVVEPYLLLFKWSSWYLLCYCLEKNDFRMFKLNRLWEISFDDQTYTPREIPKELLDIKNYFNHGIRLVALFEKHAKYRLIEEYGLNCFQEADGRLVFINVFSNKSYMMQWLLSFGDLVEVIEPRELREELIQITKNSLEKYEEHDI